MGEVSLIKQAPVIFITALLVLTVIAWRALAWRYKGIIDAKDGIIALYKERLNGATPDQAKAKIDELEQRVKRLSAFSWTPLTPHEKSALRSHLANLKPGQIYVHCSGSDCVDLATDFVELLSQVGWHVQKVSGSFFGIANGIVVSPDNLVSRRLKEAIEMSTALTPQISGPQDQSNQAINLIIGTKSY